MNERRILWALVASVVIALIFTFAVPRFFGPAEPPRPSRTAAAPAKQEPRPQARERTASAAKRDRTASREPAQRVQGPRPREQLAHVSTRDFGAALTTRGATVETFTLKSRKFRRKKDGRRVPVDLVSTEREKWLPLRIGFRSSDFAYQDQNVDYDLVSSGRGRAVFEYASAEVRIRRTYEARGAFQLLLTTEITNLTDEEQSHKLELSTFRYLRWEEEKGGLFQQSPWVVTGVCEHGGETERFARGDMWSERSTAGAIGYAALDDLYFAQALLPDRGTQAECRMKARALPQGALYRASLVYQETAVAPGATVKYRTRAYFGPKDHDGLAKVDARLQSVVDFGFFAPLCRILLHVLKFFQGFVANWGLAIILLTLSVKTLLFPVTQKSFKSMREMQRVKPLIDELNQRYANDKEKRNQAMMALYKQHKINPFGGCLPIVIQTPIGLALYTTLWRAIELYQEPFTLYWVDLSAPDPYFVLPLVLGATMFIQQKMTPSTLDAMQQKMMMYFMPIMFTAFMLFLPVGLTLYILTNTLLTIAQQQFMYRRHPVPAAVPAPAPTAPGETRAPRQRPARRRG
ncbi:MAG: membrane protein insertase YidC [Deltaproteobacteria bacterium]|nr:membrane protein insertase YidC [Deltaproteobacteria bacterium]